MAARLQHQLHDIAVPRGTFLIGRGADCQLSLDDPLVSRRHAAIRIADDGAAVVEDLGSRNGVLLNGVRIDKPEPLRDGDVIRIGSQDISFIDAPVDSHPAGTSRARVTMQQLDVSGLVIDPAASPASAPVTAPAGAPASQPPSSKKPASGRIPVAIGPDGEPSSARPSQRGLPATIPMPMVRELRPVEPDDPGETTTIASAPFGAGAGRSVSGLAIIGSVADKALVLGRAEEAERILQRSLSDVMARALQGDVDAELAEHAGTYAVRLAAGTGRGAWIDYVFQLYTTLRALMPARLVDELYAAVRKVKATDKSVLRTYTTRLKEISSGFGPAERFVQQRIEGFERWAP